MVYIEYTMPEEKLEKEVNHLSLDTGSGSDAFFQTGYSKSDFHDCLQSLDDGPMIIVPSILN